MFVFSRVLNRYRTDGTVGDDVYWKSARMQSGQ
jgi:cob(I)alamin adenosyltransferase